MGWVVNFWQVLHQSRHFWLISAGKPDGLHHSDFISCSSMREEMKVARQEQNQQVSVLKKPLALSNHKQPSTSNNPEDNSAREVENTKQTPIITHSSREMLEGSPNSPPKQHLADL